MTAGKLRQYLEDRDWKTEFDDDISFSKTLKIIEGTNHFEYKLYITAFFDDGIIANDNTVKIGFIMFEDGTVTGVDLNKMRKLAKEVEQNLKDAGAEFVDGYIFVE